MALTPKQERNGISVEGGTQEMSTLAQPGPMTAPPVGQAMAAAEVRGGEGHDLMSSPSGSGSGGHEVGGYGSMFEWDAGLAISDVEGGGSG